MSKGFSGHHLPVEKSDEWVTPREILLPLGHFDLDPCAPLKQPWPTAQKTYTLEDNGLIQDWMGRVWLNPPYGDTIIKWMERMAKHGDGVALTFVRSDTEWFQRWVLNWADSLLFLDGRINFCTVAGTRARSNGGAPSVLIAYGERNVECLEASGLKGKHVLINNVPMVVVTVSGTWKMIVTKALIRLNGKGTLKQIYDLVETLAPDKLERNQHYQAKVRQVLQKHFTRIDRGYYLTLEN